MGQKELRDEIDAEVSAILASDFTIQVTNTEVVPHSSDASITFPNLDARTQGTKLIDTCVLYIDIRRSTDLNLSHKPKTVAKLYSAFVRAMTRVARYFHGHVRGIIGDRVMVIFDQNNCFANAVECAIAMNTVATYIVNKRFKANEVTCGVGIDAGKMLATKTGVRRHGAEQGNYRNLVWLGRPANVASKLTDVANKPGESHTEQMVEVAYERPRLDSFLFPPIEQSPLMALPPSNPFSSPALANALSGVPSFNPFASALSLAKAAQEPTSATNWHWVRETAAQFLSQLEMDKASNRLVHKNPRFRTFFLTTDSVDIRPTTPPILMTGSVWKGYRAAKPQSTVVQRSLFNKIGIQVTGFDGDIYGGNAVFPNLQ